MRCNRIEHWVHLRCAGIRQVQYRDTPSLQTLVQAPYLPTPLQPKHTHVQDTIILAITFTRMTPNYTFHLSVRIPLESLTKVNMCISDIRVWMIKNKLKINNSKTEFIIFLSPLLKQNLSDLSVSVGDMQVSPSSKVRDLGVVI